MDSPPAIASTPTDVDGVPVVLVRCSGDVDRANAYLLRTALRDAVTESGGERPVVVDLSNLTFAGAAVVDALVEGRDDAGPATAAVRVVIDHNRQLEVAAQTTRLDEAFGLYADVASAAHGRAPLSVDPPAAQTGE